MLNVDGFPGGTGGKDHLPMQEPRVWSLGWEDPLEEDTATHSQPMATQVFLPGDSQGQRSLVGYGP